MLKSTQDTEMPVILFKEKADFFADYIYVFFNEAIESSKFPCSLQLADITSVFKKGSKNQKKIYRPISILPILPKIFEKILSQQLSSYFGNNPNKR